MFYNNKPTKADKSTPGIDYRAISSRFYRLIEVSTDIYPLLAIGFWLKTAQQAPTCGPYPFSVIGGCCSLF